MPPKKNSNQKQPEVPEQRLASLDLYDEQDQEQEDELPEVEEMSGEEEEYEEVDEEVRPKGAASATGVGECRREERNERKSEREPRPLGRARVGGEYDNLVEALRLAFRSSSRSRRSPDPFSLSPREAVREMPVYKEGGDIAKFLQGFEAELEELKMPRDIGEEPCLLICLQGERFYYRAG